MATLDLRPASTILNEFTLASGAASADGILGRAYSDPTAVDPADGNLLSAPVGADNTVTVSLPGIPRLAEITGAVVHVYSLCNENQVAGGSELHVFVEDTAGFVVDDEVLFASSSNTETSQWSSSATVVNTTNQLVSLLISVFPTDGSFFRLMAAYVHVTYTSTAGIVETETLQVQFPAIGLKQIGDKDD